MKFVLDVTIENGSAKDPLDLAAEILDQLTHSDEPEGVWSYDGCEPMRER